MSGLMHQLPTFDSGTHSSGFKLFFIDVNSGGGGQRKVNRHDLYIMIKLEKDNRGRGHFWYNFG